MTDLKFAVRQLLRQPAFAIAAIGSLALGIGLNVTLFSVVNAVLLRDTSVAAPERLVEIYSGISRDFPQLTTSYPDYLDVRAGASALEGVSANAYVRGILSTSARGVLVTVGVGRVLESLLYGVSTTDPLAYATAATVLVIAAFTANLLPALNAARIDPMRALRLE